MLCAPAACGGGRTGLTIASPPGYEMDPDVLAGARRTMEHTGGSVTFTPEPHDAVRDTDAVYAEVWVPMDRPDEEEVRRRRFADYRVDDALLDRAGPDAVALHCLPANRGEEITSEVLDGPHSLAWRQAANRLPTAQAVLHTLLNTSRQPTGTHP
ncbi:MULTISPECIES: ornithine carbamoyltransferase [unclassified Streptomyces]|uniref:ornithine carbamoyltransferase n=1 Tax=unclassified Streptomyces TaxID=2593676 RepID=UPI00382C165E